MNFIYISATFYNLFRVDMLCALRHTCCWLVKHSIEHMQISMHAAASARAFIKMHQSFCKECLTYAVNENRLLNESKAITLNQINYHYGIVLVCYFNKNNNDGFSRQTFSKILIHMPNNNSSKPKHNRVSISFYFFYWFLLKYIALAPVLNLNWV